MSSPTALSSPRISYDNEDGSDATVAVVPNLNTGSISQEAPEQQSKSTSAQTKVAKRNLRIFGQSMPVPTATRGTADIIGFGASGVFVLRNGFNLQLKKGSSDFSYDAGWRVDKHVRVLADTTGDGLLDIVGFGDKAVWIAVNNGDNTFQPVKKAIEEFSYRADVWRVEKHVRFMADLRNTGRADIVGFGNHGVLVSLNKGDGKFSPPRYGLRDDFGYSEGGGDWRLENHLRFLSDVTGNGFLDILGFGNDAVYVAEGKGDGTFYPARVASHDMCYNRGWLIEKHPRFVADLTGNGYPDLIGFFSDGVYASFNTGDTGGTFMPSRKLCDGFSYNSGWRVEKHLICIADLTGNGCGDIVGFGEEGVYISTNNGDGTFQHAKLAVTDFSYNKGWRVSHHPRIVVDLTGNACADIIGFGSNGVYVTFNDGEGNFGPVKKLVDEFGCNAEEWSKEIAPRYVANIYC